MTTTLTASGACLVKAGANVSAEFKGANAETNWNRFINEAESFLCALSRYNWIDNYAIINADVKKFLDEAVSNLAAIYAIQHDMSGYTSRIEAEDMINILWARFNQCIKLLEDQNVVTYMKGA